MMLSNYLYFSAPNYLWGLLLLAVLAVILRRRIKALQLIAAALLIVCAAGPQIIWPWGNPREVVLREKNSTVALEKIRTKFPHAQVRTYQDDLAAQLAQSGARLPGKNSGTIHIYGDFSHLDGAVVRQCALLHQRQIPVVFHPEKSVQPLWGVQLLRSRLPETATWGETVEWQVALNFPRPAQLQLEILSRQGEVLQQQIFSGARGVQYTTIPVALHQAGTHHLQLRINRQIVDTLPLTVSPKLKALLISQRPELEQKALQKLTRDRLSITPWSSQQNLADYPLYIIGERGSSQLTPAQQRILLEQVRRGAGVSFFTGRELPFRPDQVTKEFAELLPVRYNGRSLDRTPTTALVVIIDTSGSMGGTRIALAREVARLALDQLRDCDIAGIIEFHGRRRWAAPLQSAANHLELRRALNRLNAGGGTIILPSVMESFYALRNIDTRLKHVLILTDGGVERGDFEGLLRQMAQNDITVSTVMVGPGESEFLTQLALWGNGRYYNAASRFALPELTFRQSGKESLPPSREGQLPLQVISAQKLFKKFPPRLTIGGVLENELLPTGSTELAADGLPLLAVRPYGAGQAAIFNSELAGHWVQNLLQHPAFSALLSARLRNLPDPARRNPVVWRNLSAAGEIHLQLDGLKLPPQVQAKLHLPNGTTEKFLLKRSADGAFHFRRPNNLAGIYTLQLQQPPFATTITWGAGALHEEIPLPDAAPTIATLNRRAQQLPPPQYCVKFYNLRPELGGLFMILMLLQILLRRWPSRAVALMLLGCLALPASAGEYENSLRNGLRGIQPDQAYAQAVQYATNPVDRRFAAALQLENARTRGQLPQLLKTWSKQKDLDLDRLELLLDTLEDLDRAPEALEILKHHKQREHQQLAPRLIRLAERCHQSALVRAKTRQMLNSASDQLLWLNAALRLELLAGRRAEAQQLLKNYIQKTRDPETLLALTDTAEKAALYTEAELALDRLQKLSPHDPWPVEFRKLELWRRSHQLERAVAALQKLSLRSNLPTGVLMRAADLSEQFGDTENALVLYEKAAGEEATIRSAMLLEGMEIIESASAKWWQIFRTSTNAMRIRQATGRLLVLARAEERLPELCAELKEELQRHYSPKVELFYCLALVANKQEKVLFQHLDQAVTQGRSGAEKLKLDFLLQLKKYPQAAEFLQELLKKYPAERTKYLQQLTMVALESKNPGLAQQTTNTMIAEAKNLPDKITALEFSAGVCALMRQYQRASELYRQCLNLAPDKIELHLLLANAERAAGRGQGAIEQFLTQLDKPLPPDLFGVMVDGLLNLRAPAPVLKTALKKVQQRIEHDPELLFYYRLAEDLAEELNDQNLWRQLQKLQLAAAPERRSLLLRRLFEDARLREAHAEAVHYARLLLYLDEIYAPDFYHQLSQSLIASGNFAAAERCIRRADAAVGGTANLFNFIETCLETGHLDSADRIARELLCLTPDSAPLFIRYATVLEMRRDYPRALDYNLKALQKIASQISAERKAARRGSFSANFARQYRPLINATANLLVLEPNSWRAKWAQAARQATPGAQKMVWLPLQRRVTQLLQAPRLRHPVSRRPVKRPPRAAELAAQLAQLTPAKQVQVAHQILTALTPARRALYLPHLLANMQFNPAPELEKELLQQLEKTPLRDLNIYEPASPWALKLKNAYLQKLLVKFPNSFNAQVMLAELYYQQMQAPQARVLAGLLIEQFVAIKKPDIGKVRLFRRLFKVYADAPNEAPGTGAQSRDEAREMLQLADEITYAHTLLLALLHEHAGEFDSAVQLLFDSWRKNSRELAGFLLMDELAARSGRVTEYLQVLLNRPPKDSSSYLLYCRRMCQLLREAGNGVAARRYLNGLPVVLQKREKLLIDREILSENEFNFGFQRFLIEQCRTQNFVGFYGDNYGLGGLLEHHAKYVHRVNRLDDLVHNSSALRPTLEYLLRGTAVTERAFAPLFAALHQLPPVPPALPEATTPAQWAIRATRGQVWTKSEVHGVLQLLANAKVPPENAALFLPYLPLDKQPSGRQILLKRILQGICTHSNLQLAEQLLAQLPAADRVAVAPQLAVWGTDRYDFDLQFFRTYLWKRFFPTAPLPPSPVSTYPADTELFILYGAGQVSERVAAYFTATNKEPDWSKILFMVAPQVKDDFLLQVQQGLKNAAKRQLIAPDQMVHNLVLLAEACPQQRAVLLHQAAQYDAKPSAASLWILDLLTGKEQKQLQKQLGAAGRLAPIRANKLTHPPTHKEKK